MSELLERCAEAAYEASVAMSDPGVRHEPWANLPVRWQRIFRHQAKAVLDVINPPTTQPDPTDYDTDLFGEPA